MIPEKPARIARHPQPLRKPFATSSTLATITLAGLLGCGAAPDETQLGDPAAVVGAGGSSSPSNAPAVNPLGRARCRPPAGMSGSPSSIADAVVLLNALPKPTSVACFVESLDRPLAVYATNSTFSAQPALSTRSPRLFIKIARLWLSVVIDGQSSYLVEFGQIVDDAGPRSLKGELKLPINDPVPASEPYDRVLYGQGTGCGLCHGNEQRAADIGFATAFSSLAFRPRPETRVHIDDLRLHDQQCDWQTEPHRCEMLAAVFQGGSVDEVPFPDTMSTFF